MFGTALCRTYTSIAFIKCVKSGCLISLLTSSGFCFFDSRTAIALSESHSSFNSAFPCDTALCESKQIICRHVIEPRQCYDSTVTCVPPDVILQSVIDSLRHTRQSAKLFRCKTSLRAQVFYFSPIASFGAIANLFFAKYRSI